MLQESVGTTSAPPVPPSAPARRVVLVGAGLLIGFCVLLRFWTTSGLWLDEALSVNIASLSLHQIPDALRRDGAPPLFYVLLHYWIRIFGSSDLAVRSLAGLFGVVTLPLTWLAARRLGGERDGSVVAFAALILIASSPYAVYYDTDARMYSLVSLLTVLGVLALQGVLRKPSLANLGSLAAVTALLLYTHYWSLYLIGVTGLWLTWRAVRAGKEGRRAAGSALVAILVGCLVFVPWLPIFLYQLGHTGTPWAVPANFAAMVNAISSFAGGPTNQGRALALIYFALLGLGIFGVAKDRRTIELDLAARPRARPLAVILGGTLAAAIVGGYLSHSAFDARYAAVVYLPLILLAALGISTFLSPLVRAAVLVVAVACGMVSAIPNITSQRTQATNVAAALGHLGVAGDVVAYCPDQLGPDTSRLLPTNRYQQITFPRGNGPQFVDWVDYEQAISAADPVNFAAKLEQMAGSIHQIWFVWAPGYQAYGVKCEAIQSQLLTDRSIAASDQFPLNPSFGEPMELVRFVPLR